MLCLNELGCMSFSVDDHMHDTINFCKDKEAMENAKKEVRGPSQHLWTISLYQVFSV